jgi:Carboxypeptidase regulatory-like domain
MFCQLPAYGQTVTASLSGTVTDATGAVIPNAKVALTSDETSVVRNATSNSAGFFNFAGLMPGSYTLEVSAEGMVSWQLKGIVLHSQETRAVPNIMLKVGMAKQEVTVVAEGAEPVLLSSGQSSTTLNNTMVSQLSVQGRDAAELIKLMPGMAINNGLNNSEWNSALTQINSGPIGAFAASGTQPNGGLQMIMNGSVITDAGNQGTQIANVNQDMTQEVTIQNASFDAEHAHGPVTFSATGKSGGDKFHGAAYAYTRNGSLNANDSFFNASGVVKPIDHYWYLGGNIGGPVIIPGTRLKKGSDKAFFFFGFEHMKQEPNGTLHKYAIPTAPMMTGDFTASTLSHLSGFSGAVPCASPGAWNYGNYCQGAVDNGLVTLYQTGGAAWTPAAWDSAIAAHNADPDNVPFPTASGATIAGSELDPNGVALMQALAASPGLKHINPTAGNPYNAEFFDSPPILSKNLNVRGDVNITEKVKVFGTFTRQPETDQNNIGVWWWEPIAVPYPSPMPAKQVSRTWSVGVTTLFSPTLINEATFGYAYFLNPITLTNPSAADPSSTGYNVPLPAGFSQNVPQYPAEVTWCCGDNSGGGGNATSATTAAGFQAPSFGASWLSNGAFGKDSYTPDFSDALTWVKSSHTMKFGFFWAAYANVQTENCCGGGTAGSWDFDNYGSNTSFNYYSDMFIGHAQSFSTTNNNPTDYVKYNEFDVFAQDSWKASRRLTLSFGVRFERMGQWYTFGASPKGLMVWDPTNAVQPYDAANLSPLMGFDWNAIDKNVPLSGWTSPTFKADPRIGVAFDMFGNGKTVLRGGFGLYRYQVAYNDVTENGILSAPLGTIPFASNCTFTKLTDLSGCAAGAAGALNTQSYGGLLKGDTRTPYTQTWNIMIDQRAPLHSMFEIQYQGNRSRDMLISQNGAGGVGLANINYYPMGSRFQPDPVTGITYYWQGTADATHLATGPDSGSNPDYRPYAYSGLYEFRHGSYANYNALMVQWMKQAGPFVFNINYTWSHALGIRDGNNDNGQGSGASLDAFNLANNYGVLAFNRAQIFNASYVFNLPSPAHGNRFEEGFVNGWQLSGDTQFQTGVPLQPLTGGRLNASFPAGVSNDSVLGTDGIQLVPLLTCNPGANLQSGQYFNPNCFQSPSIPVTGGASVVGQNGPLSWPNIPGPGFFNSDIGLYKNFKITERQGLQFRITAFNFLNHPLPQFALTNDINLAFATEGGTNTNANTTGKPAYTVGRRTVELALKYTF